MCCILTPQCPFPLPHKKDVLGSSTYVISKTFIVSMGGLEQRLVFVILHLGWVWIPLKTCHGLGMGLPCLSWGYDGLACLKTVSFLAPSKALPQPSHMHNQKKKKKSSTAVLAFHFISYFDQIWVACSPRLSRLLLIVFSLLMLILSQIDHW